MRNRTRITILVVLALLVVSVIATVQPAGAWCWEGCTPGFWKQAHHFWAWDPVPQTMLLEGVFECVPYDLDGDGEADTLLDALNYRGGRGFEGKARNLLRIAAAAYLNTQTMDHYGWPNFIGAENGVNDALCAGDINQMARLYHILDHLNNQYCVFSPEYECPVCPE